MLFQFILQKTFNGRYGLLDILLFSSKDINVPNFCYFNPCTLLSSHFNNIPSRNYVLPHWEVPFSTIDFRYWFLCNAECDSHFINYDSCFRDHGESFGLNPVWSSFDNRARTPTILHHVTGTSISWPCHHSGPQIKVRLWRQKVLQNGCFMILLLLTDLARSAPTFLTLPQFPNTLYLLLDKLLGNLLRRLRGRVPNTIFNRMFVWNRFKPRFRQLIHNPEFVF